MKSEEWIISAGVAALLCIVGITMFSDDLWEDDYRDAPPIPAGIMAPHRDGRENVACASCHVIVARPGPGAGGGGNPAAPVAPPPIPANASIPPTHMDGRDRMACINCHVILNR